MQFPQPMRVPDTSAINGLEPRALSPEVPEADVFQRNLEKGVRVEMEHTNDPNLAQKIAMDHLRERPDYYDLLEQVMGPEPMAPQQPMQPQQPRQQMNANPMTPTGTPNPMGRQMAECQVAECGKIKEVAKTIERKSDAKEPWAVAKSMEKKGII